MKRIITIVAFIAICCSACGNSTITGQTPQESQSSTSALRSFALASDFPSDVVIPDIEGMRSTAFIVSAADPAGVLAVDIDATPLQLSAAFKTFTVPNGAGIPSRLAVAAKDRAFLLTSNAVISFNPESGSVIDMQSVIAPIAISGTHNNSDGSLSAPTVTPSYPGGIATAGGRLFVSSANYIRTQAPAVTAPGIVQVFDIASDGTLAPASHFVTSGFNPTGLAIRNASELLVLNSGVIDIVNAQGVAQTDASIDVVDLDTLAIKATIPLGPIAAAPYGIALTLDGSRGFAGSAAYGDAYEIDLINRQVLRGKDNPIVVSDSSDYVSALALSVDDQYLYASSFEQSAVVPFDLSAADPARGNPFVVGFPSGVTDENPSGANTGAGPLAVRPGSRDIDYQGEDLFILTGYPGTMIAVNSGAPAQKYTQPTDDSASQDNSAAQPPPAPPSGSNGTPCQGFAQAVKGVAYGTGAGFGQASFPDIVLGAPRGAGELSGGTHVLSLGKGGEITLDLGNCPAVDKAGDDFIVFENAFYIGGNPLAPYAEPAIVSASEDGTTFVDFACSSAAYPYDGCAGWHPVYSNPQNAISPFDPTVAGGEAYDLSAIGLAKARYIRIRDAGNGGGAGSAGFDLDAIAVINGEIVN